MFFAEARVDPQQELKLGSEWKNHRNIEAMIAKGDLILVKSKKT